MPPRFFLAVALVLPMALTACGVKSDLEPPGGAMALDANATRVSTRPDPSRPQRPLGQRERDESATTAATTTALPPTGP